MPIYEYSCTHCKKNFEIFQKITDKPRKRCSVCHGKLEKIVSQSSFLLKGAGWYKTQKSEGSCPGGQCQSPKPQEPSSQCASK